MDYDEKQPYFYAIQKELAVIEDLQNDNKCLNTHIYTKVIHNHNFVYLISNYYTGDLSKLVKNNNLSMIDKIEITKQVIKSCICLKNINYYYIDMKPDNILYSCTGDKKNELKISLADIGSIQKIDSDIKNPSTYPLPYYHRQGIISRNLQAQSPHINLDELTCIWGIILLFLSLHVNDTFYPPSWEEHISIVYGILRNYLDYSTEIESIPLYNNCLRNITNTNIINGTYIQFIPKTLEELLLLIEG